VSAHHIPAVQEAGVVRRAPKDPKLVGAAQARQSGAAVAARRPAYLDPRAVLTLQRQIGNASVGRLVRARDYGQRANGPVPSANQVVMKSKTEAITGGLEGLKLDITFNVAGEKATTLQCIQAWWGSGSTLGKKVGKTPIKIGKKEYEAFIDGGKFSPYVTMSGMDPAHPTQPYYLTADEHKNQVTWNKDTGTIRTTDLPSASALFEEMFFETAIVAVDVDGKGTDKILRVFTWGSTKQGTVTQHEKGDKIGEKYSHIESMDSPSSTFKEILKNDYPDYKYVTGS
jgi:hypothetical protein